MVNDGDGHFIDQTIALNKEIANIGMVTGAVWANVAGGPEKELVITGEWMAPRIFSYRNNHFEEIKTNLSDQFGWWQTVAAADLDGNGYDDLILGNLGENFYLKPSKEEPVKLWINDYDQNTSIDKILTRTVNHRDMPVFLKREITDQVPGIKKQNLRFRDYATKSIQELFPKELIDQSIVKQFNYSSSVIALSDGKDRFTVTRLPDEVQFSSVNAAKVVDLDGDKKLDIVLAGNSSDFLPQFGRLDASEGHILVNKGNGSFGYLNSIKSGLKAQGITRDIEIINGKRKKYILFLENNDFPLLYEVNQ